MTVPRLSRLTGTYTKPTLGRRLRRYLLVGLVVTAPIGVTVWVLRWLFTSIDSILGVPLRDLTGRSLPGVGLVILLVLLLMVGWVVHRAAGRKMLDFWNRMLSQFPLAGRIYNAVSQIVQTVIGSRRRLFIKTVLVPYPMEGSWAVAFVTNEDAVELSAVIGEPCVNVFLPTTPNPTSGFMLAVPVSRVREFDTTVEEAMKLIVSAGAVRARVSRKGIDVESLLMDTREWRRKEAAERRVKTGPRQDGPGRRKTD
jgi:uncharacterized membrane protein